MLDLDSPRTPHIFTAAKWLDELKGKLTLAASRQRGALENTLPSVAALRRLNAEHFDHSPRIEAMLDELETHLARLLAAYRADQVASAACPVCGAPVAEPPNQATRARRPRRRGARPCQPCFDSARSTLLRLESSEGFGTFAI